MGVLGLAPAMKNGKLGSWLSLAIDGDLSGVLGLAPAIHGKNGFFA